MAVDLWQNLMRCSQGCFFFWLCLLSILVFQVCLSKAPQTRWLKQQTSSLSQFWRPESKIKVSAGPCSLRRPQGRMCPRPLLQLMVVPWLLRASLPSSHGISSVLLSVSVQISLFYKDIDILDSESTLLWYDLSLANYIAVTPFPNNVMFRSTGQDFNIGISGWRDGHNSTHNNQYRIIAIFPGRHTILEST